MSSKEHTKEEGWKIAIRLAQEGDKEKRDEVITGNMGLVYMVLRRFQNRGQEMEDLFQIGIIGLMKAIDKFDISTDYAFSTYAVPMIIGEIRRFLRDDGILHVSRQVKDNARRIAIAKEELKKRHNIDPTIQELVSYTGLEAGEILMAMEATTEVDSIYRPIGNHKDSEGNPLLLAETLEDHRATEAEMIDQITVRQILDSLKEQERILIQLRYLEGKTQSQCASLLGMNQVAVSRMEKRILTELRKQF